MNLIHCSYAGINCWTHQSYKSLFACKSLSMVCYIAPCACNLFDVQRRPVSCFFSGRNKKWEKKQIWVWKWRILQHPHTQRNRHTQRMLYNLERRRQTQCYSTGLVPGRSLVLLLWTAAKKLQRRRNEQHSLRPHGYRHGTDYIVKEFGCAGHLPGYCNFMLFNLDK